MNQTPKPPIIVAGCPRSGTTLLRVLLDSHPNIFAGHELGITVHIPGNLIHTWNEVGERARQSFGLEDGDFARAYGKAIEHILERVRQKSGKPRVADKMPQAVRYFDTLCWMLPESPLVHIIRDGRDVACSMVNYDFDFKGPKGNVLKISKDYLEAAKYWKWITERGLIMRDHPQRDRYYEIFYENLVRDPEAEMRKLLKFLGEPWSERVLRHYELDHNIESSHDEILSLPHSKSIGRWKRDLDNEQIKEVYKITSPLLEKLGYDIN